MKKFIIPDAVLGKILNYLATKPYHEVAQLIDMIQTEAKPEEQKKPEPSA